MLDVWEASRDTAEPSEQKYEHIRNEKEHNGKFTVQ